MPTPSPRHAADHAEPTDSDGITADTRTAGGHPGRHRTVVLGDTAGDYVPLRSVLAAVGDGAAVRPGRRGRS
jgi:hypothetical protein